MPPTHAVGNLERPKRLPPDPRKEFSTVDPVVYESAHAFKSATNGELAKRPAGKRRVLLLILGYNETILRISQFGENNGYEGLPLLFSRASAARLSHYVYDLKTVLMARNNVKKLALLVRSTNAERADLFAHSTGTLLPIECLVDAARQDDWGMGGSSIT